MLQKIMLLAFSILIGCVQSKKPEQKKRSSLKYATEYRIEQMEDYYILQIDEPWQGSSKAYQYVIFTTDEPQLPDSLIGAVLIKAPVGTIASNSTTHLPMMEVLGEEERLSGFAQTQFISSDLFRKRVELGQIKEIGHNAQVNLEVILDLNPDVFLAFNTSNDNGSLIQLERNGIDVVYIADYKESTVLGRAEWIKVVGLLTGKEKLAKQYFETLVFNYDSLREVHLGSDEPTVLSGTLYGGNWFAPAGENYNAHLIKDAGAKYVFENQRGSGWLNLDFEIVFSKGWDADFWIGVANFSSLEEMKGMDERYAGFEAFKNKNVFTYTARVNENGANDYFESGQMNPDRLLADHIKILHPQSLPDYELYYYKKLK